MEKEKVLEFEIIKTSNIGIIGKLKQNTEILKRYKDTKYSRSYMFPSWDFINKKLYTYGDDKYDDLIFTIPREDVDLFLDKINCINEKYGIKKRWRAEKDEFYWYVDYNLKVYKDKENYHEIDDERYEVGNYFKTKEEAEVYAEKFRKMLIERELNKNE